MKKGLLSVKKVSVVFILLMTVCLYGCSSNTEQAAQKAGVPPGL